MEAYLTSPEWCLSFPRISRRIPGTPLTLHNGTRTAARRAVLVLVLVLAAGLGDPSCPARSDESEDCFALNTPRMAASEDGEKGSVSEMWGEDVRGYGAPEMLLADRRILAVVILAPSVTSRCV